MGLLCIVLSLTIVYFPTALATNTMGGCATSETVVTNLTCTFEKNSCGWLQTTTSCHFQWTIANDRGPVITTNPEDSKIYTTDEAKLESTLICTNDSGIYSIQFRYRIQSNNNTYCQITLNAGSEGNLSSVWEANTDTNSQFQFVNKTIPMFSQDFKVIIAAQKLQNGSTWCRIDIAGVIVQHQYISTPLTSDLPMSSASTITTKQPGESSLTSTATPTLTTLIQLSSSPATTRQPMSTTSTQPQIIQEAEDGGLSAGATAGIAVGLLLVLLVTACVTAIVLVRRKGSASRKVPLHKILKNFRKSKHRNPPAEETLSVPNSPNSWEDGGASGLSKHGQRTGNQPKLSGAVYSVPRNTLGNGCSRMPPGHSDYEIAEVPESSNYYSVAVHEDGTPTIRPANKTQTQSPDYELAAVVESGGDYSTVDDADEYAKVKKPKGGNYNKLSFQNPGFDGKAEDTYNHIQDEKPVYKVPRSDGNEYSLATNPGASSAGHSAGGGSESHYVIVDGKGKDAAARGGDDEYNHLNLWKDRSANVPDSTHRGTGAGVYNHLDDQNQGPPGVQTEDTYNRVNYDGHTQDQNRKQNAGNYSHIGGF